MELGEARETQAFSLHLWGSQLRWGCPVLPAGPCRLGVPEQYLATPPAPPPPSVSLVSLSQSAFAEKQYCPGLAVRTAIRDTWN